MSENQMGGRLLLIVGIVAVVAAIGLVGRRSARREPPDDEVAATPPPEEQRPPRRVRVPSFVAPSARRGGGIASRIARLRGRVLAPPGTEGIAVEADDGTASFAAKVDDDGAFTLRLPARTYTLTAYTEELVGIEEVEAVADAEREVTIRLGPMAAIRGAVRPAPEHGIALSVRRSGTALAVGNATVAEDGSFEARGLVEGRAYDLVFTGDELRETRRIGIVPPVDGLEVTMEPLPVLRGAVGHAPDEPCPVDSAAIIDGDESEPMRIDRRCRFESGALRPGSQVVVRASSPGRHFEGMVSIPETGDPEPLCLNPPCADGPPEPRTTLQATVEGATRGMSAFTGTGGCGSSHKACELADLPTGSPIEIDVSASGCAAIPPQTVILQPGRNRLSVTCRPLRKVEGFLIGAVAPAQLEVRCAGGQVETLTRSRVFEIHCASEAAVVEYRIRGGPWRQAPIPAAGDPPLVEIALR